MAEGQRMTAAQRAVERMMQSEHVDVIRESVAAMVAELIEAEIAQIPPAMARVRRRRLVRRQRYENLLEPGVSDFGDYLAGFELRADGGKVVARWRFRHRLTVGGDPIPYVTILACVATAGTV